MKIRTPYCEGPLGIPGTALCATLCTLLSLIDSVTARRHFHLRQGDDEDAEDQYDTDTERYFDYTNAFLAGFKSQETLPSATECTKYLEQSILVYNTTYMKWQDEEIAAETTRQEYIFNTTEWISYSLAPSSLHCFKTSLEGFSWYLYKKSQFTAFGDIFAAWLQNLLGNVITFNSLYKKIEEATEAENTKEIYFWYGRFAILFIDFEPLVEDDIDSLDDEFGFDDNFMATEVPLVEAQSNHKMLRESSVGRRESPKVSGFFGNSFALVNGFVNASFGDASPNAKICETNITRIISYGFQFRRQVKDQTEENLADAAVSAENVLEAVHPIAYSCYTSIDEFGQTSEYYMDTFSDFNKVSYNLIHKLGNIYDTVYYLTRH